MPPLSLLIKPVSGACNMRCEYCFYQDVMQNREKQVLPRMTPETLENLVRRAFVYAEGSVSFAFQGGEPTLVGLEFFETLIRLQKKYNTRRIAVHNAVQTNGLELSDDMLDFFAREKFLVGVSLDGDRDTHDLFRKDASGQPTYEKVLANIRRMQEKNVDFNILCVVTEALSRKGRECMEALKEFPFLQFIPCLDDLDGSKNPGSLTENGYLNFLCDTFDVYYAGFQTGDLVSVRNFDNYISMLLGAPPESCAMAGRCGNYYLIESDGSVYPCDFYVLDEWKMGNINEQSFIRLEKNETGKRFRDRSIPVPEKCRGCRWYMLCRNGCCRERNEDGVNKWCSVYSRFFDYSVERMQRLAAKVSEP